MFQSTEPKRPSSSSSTFVPNKRHTSIKHVIELIRHGKLPTTRDTPKMSRSMLSLVVEYEQHQLVFFCPIKDINAHDNQGNTVLHYVAENRSTKTLNALLEEYGDHMDINALNHRGETPLDRVMDSKPRRAKSALIRILKKHKALSNTMINNNGQTPLEEILTLNNRFHPQGATFAERVDESFYRACVQGSANDVYPYIAYGIVDINAMNVQDQQTPLMAGIQNRHANAVVKMLLTYHADPYRTNRKGRLFLHYINDYFTNIKLIESLDVKQLNHLDRKLQTPLDIALTNLANHYNNPSVSKLYHKIITDMIAIGCQCYQHDEKGLMTTKGYGSLNTLMIDCARTQSYSTFASLYNDKDRYSKGIALLEAAKYENIDTAINIFLHMRVSKKARDSDGNIFLHYVPSWTYTKQSIVGLSTIFRQCPPSLFTIKNHYGETPNDLIAASPFANLNRKKTCEKHDVIQYQLEAPTSIQKNIYHWNTNKETLTVRIQKGYHYNINYKDLTNTWCAVLVNYTSAKDTTRTFRHVQDYIHTHTCKVDQRVICCYNEYKQQLEIVYVYTSYCQNKSRYNRCSCIAGICTKAVGYTLYALKDYVLQHLNMPVTSGHVEIQSSNPCNAFNCYNRAFLLNGFYLDDESRFDDFRNKEQIWYRENNHENFEYAFDYIYAPHGYSSDSEDDSEDQLYPSIQLKF